MTSNRYEVDDEIYLTDLVTDEDIPSLIKYLNNPTLYANTLKIPSPYTAKDGEDFIKMVKANSPDSNMIFIVRLNTNNELIGACGFHRSLKNERRAEIGYWLGEPYWHRGLASKVVKKLTEIGKTQ